MIELDCELERILGGLWGRGIDSANRLQIMLDEVWHLPGELFWPVFHKVWPTTDATWRQQDELVELLQFHQPMEEFLKGQDRVFYEQLPDVIQIYRGSSRDRVHGLSWTIDRRIAESFARGHRGVPVPEPVVARVSIPKSAVLAISIERGESELLVDPDSISANAMELA
ncbi:hypothetical protein EN933_10800 [Mesorhizobium sp. M7A.F.Ca.US.001.01.1.1]|nr:hypothetical protein EN933_10800 [Mesorhizobium sp. M7A.F.Ca.US.001.01.1.1]